VQYRGFCVAWSLIRACATYAACTFSILTYSISTKICPSSKCASAHRWGILSVFGLLSLCSHSSCVPLRASPVSMQATGAARRSIRFVLVGNSLSACSPARSAILRPCYPPTSTVGDIDRSNFKARCAIETACWLTAVFGDAIGIHRQQLPCRMSLNNRGSQWPFAQTRGH